MKRKEVKELLPIMEAYSEGKDIEILNINGEWELLTDPVFDDEPSRYRIKPETTYRAFKSKEECWEEMKKFQPFGWVKDKYTDQYSIISILEKSTDFDFLFKTYTFIDGTPFGIKEE